MKRFFPLLLVAVLNVIVLIPTNGKTWASSNQRKRTIIRQVKASPSVQIHTDNSQGSMLYIREAAVKEISGDDFAVLVGASTNHLKQSTFPDVTMLNGYSKTISSFAIVLQSAVEDPRNGHVFLK